jgi:hypothetical protein
MNKNESRRKLLKSIAAGSGAIVAGKSLPESWSKPVVDSVMLPAHAQTSPAEPPVEPPAPNPFPCIGQSASTPPGSSNAVFINFDGDSICSVSLASSDDSALLVDADTADGDTGDIQRGWGNNWVSVAGEEANVPAGQYTRQVTRTGGAAVNPGAVYDVTFTFSTVGSGSTYSLTLTLDNIVAV